MRTKIMKILQSRMTRKIFYLLIYLNTLYTIYLISFIFSDYFESSLLLLFSDLHQTKAMMTQNTKKIRKAQFILRRITKKEIKI